MSFYYVYYVPSFCTLNMYLNVAVCRSLKCCGLYSDMNELLQILLHRISGVLYPIKHYSYEFVLIFCIETYLYPCSDSLSICMWKITCCYTYFFRRFTSVLSKIFWAPSGKQLFVVRPSIDLLNSDRSLWSLSLGLFIVTSSM